DRSSADRGQRERRLSDRVAATDDRPGADRRRSGGAGGGLGRRAPEAGKSMSRSRDAVSSWARGLPERHGSRTLVVLALIVAIGFGLRAHRALDPLDHPGDDARAYF